jgi:hypothetical protein
MPVQLSAPLIESFAGTFLSPLYDNPRPTPQFHREAWELYSTGAELCAVAAPREHAKSTALTHDYVLAVLLFRVQDYVVVASATEDLAIGHLGDIAKELRENEDLIREFGIVKLPVDGKTEIEVRFADGHESRIIAKGSGQKMRGLKWHGKRPGLIICDDLEEDDQVSNRDRRIAFGKWFRRALLPARRRGGQVRVHGTILHEDSLLANLMKSKVWQHRFYRAHQAFDDFSNILWPEQFPETRLRDIRLSYVEAGDAAGYSQEYLNDPFDNSEAYLRRDDFAAMGEDDYDSPKSIKVGCDFAVSKADRANRTSFTVGGQDTGNLVHILDQHVGRWDPVEWIDELFSIEEAWHPDEFIVEGGVIWKSIERTLFEEMRHRDLYLNITVINPVKDKAARGRPLQKRHRARSMRFDKKADWYAPYEDEMLRFTGNSDAMADDQFDSTAILIKGFEAGAIVTEADFWDEDTIELHRGDPRQYMGRCPMTGY